MPKGRCTNFDKPCPKHVNEEIIEVPEGADFVCPECGRDLMTVTEGPSPAERINTALSDPRTLAAAVVAFLLLGIGGWLLSGSESPRTSGYSDGTAVESPSASDDSGTVAEERSSTINVVSNDSDPEGQGLSVTQVSSPSNGSVTNNNDGTITYTHDGSETTSDSFTYTVSDGNGGTAQATVTITVPANKRLKKLKKMANNPEVSPEELGHACRQALVDFPHDYRFPLLQAKHAISGVVTGGHHAGFKYFKKAAEDAIKSGDSAEMLRKLNRQKHIRDNPIWKLAHGHASQWNPIVEALKEKSVHHLQESSEGQH